MGISASNISVIIMKIAFLVRLRAARSLGHASAHSKNTYFIPQLLVLHKARSGAGGKHVVFGLLQERLGAEGLVVQRGGRVDEVLQVRAHEKVAQRDELAMCFIFHYKFRNC